MLPVICILVVGAWIMGATTLEEFGLALGVGLVAGAYSSIFIATPIVAMLKEREPQYRLVREKLGRKAGEYRPSGRREGTDDLQVPSEPVAARSDGERVTAGAASSSRPATAPGAPSASRPLPPGYSASHPPRPRKKGRR
jgi:preprotein translocase subunit SecF